MVTLDKIYTRGGDGGETSLTGGKRVAKHDLRVAAYGTVDEANAAIGVARLHVAAADAAVLSRIQNDLFDLGADFSTPGDGPSTENGKAALRIGDTQVERLEQEIDKMNADLAPLTSFILPGGTPASAYLHLARTVVRRAERLATELATREAVNAVALKYLNRLSDHLFVMARQLNEGGKLDVLWEPGHNRPGHNRKET